MTKGSDLLVCRPRKRGRGPDFWRARRRKPRRRGVAADIAHRIDRDAARAGGRLHGGDAWAADRAARRLHLDAGARRAQLLDRRGLCPSRRHADDHDHRAEADHERQAGAVPDRRRDRIDAAADQDDAADRQRPQHPDRRSRCLQGRDGRASRPGASGASRRCRGETRFRIHSADSGASARTSARPSRRDRSRGRDDHWRPSVRWS